MPFRRTPRPSSILASALATGGVVLAVASCSNIAPLGPDPGQVSLPPARDLGSPISMQVMRSQSPDPAGQCPAGSVSLVGLDPAVPRASMVSSVPVQSQATQGSGATANPSQTPTATPTAHPALPVGVACFLRIGEPVTITSAAVSSVATFRPPPGQPKGPTSYGFMVALPAADAARVTALIRRAYDSGDAVGMSVGGKLWQAPQVRSPFSAQQLQINLLSRNQAVQLYRLLVRSG